jgi:hypothetical protein
MFMASCHSNGHKLHATCLRSPLTDTSLVPLTADYPTSNIAMYCHAVKYSLLEFNNKIQVNNNILRIVVVKRNCKVSRHRQVCNGPT